MRLLDGKKIAQILKNEAQAETHLFEEKGLRTPGFAAIQVGSVESSNAYVTSQKKACEKAGFQFHHYRLSEQDSEEELVEVIQFCNQDDTIDGILLQMPLPSQMDEQKVLALIDPWKDVDCFNPVNAGKMLLGLEGFLPCTPAGVIELLKRSRIPLTGKKAVVLGRSNIVGKPQALLLLRENCTVTLCHSKTQNLPEICSTADILVSAIGKPNMVTPEFVHKDQIVVDVAINPLPDGTLVGDVDFDAVKDKVEAITPVPGGVGPMTIAMLLKQTLKAYRHHLNLEEPSLDQLQSFLSPNVAKDAESSQSKT